MKWHITNNGLEGLTIGDITPEKSVEWWETKKVIRRNCGFKELCDFLKREIDVIHTISTTGEDELVYDHSLKKWVHREFCTHRILEYKIKGKIRRAHIWSSKFK